MGAQRGYKRPVTTPQIEIHVIPFHVTDVSGTPTFVITTKGQEDLGGGSLTVSRTAAGDYTLTLKTPAARYIVAGSFTPDVANLSPQVVSRTASAIRVKFTNNSGTLTETGFCGAIWIHDDIALRG